MSIFMDRVVNDYFNWLVELVNGDGYSRQFSYRKLLTHLHETEFRYSIPNDQNRESDGIDLRRRFILMNELEDEYDFIMRALSGPCSVLEMMIALAIRCEEQFMDDPNIGDRSAQWFWGMIINLELGPMMDYQYDRRIVDTALDIFLDRRYEANGRGGLFTIDNCDQDLRKVEIWYQLCWYLDGFM